MQRTHGVNPRTGHGFIDSQRAGLGCSKPGEIVWSRVFIMDGILHVDLGRGHVVDLPAEETQRRLDATNPEWPIMHAVLHGVSRDQLMARHKANHVQVVYARMPRRRTRRSWPRRPCSTN